MITRLIKDYASPGSERPDDIMEGIDVRELKAPGLNGDPDVTIRLYSRKYSPGPVSALLWMLGLAPRQLRKGEEFRISVVRKLGIMVADVHYRFPTQTPYIGQVNDCYAALEYLHAHAEELGIDTIAVGGQDDGAGLAADTAILARDKGEIPIAFQLLEEPTFDAAPARAALAGLPPAYLSTMECDPACDEGIRYSMAMLDAGVSVELHSFPRLPSAFHPSAPVAAAELSQRQHAEVLAALDRALSFNP